MIHCSGVASFLGWIFDGYRGPHSYRSSSFPDSLVAYARAIQGRRPDLGRHCYRHHAPGWGIGSLLGGTLADYVGRKRMMILSVFFYGLFSGITALSTTYIMLVVLRFITGLALGSEWSTGVAMVAETWPDRARPKGAGLLQSGFGWGTLLASFVCWALSRANPLGPQTRRLMFVIGAIPAFFTLYIRRAINESERWLKAIREQRRAATETEEDQQSASKTARRPPTFTEIFRQHESRRRLLLAFLMSLATMIGWWAISARLHAATSQGPALCEFCGMGKPPGHLFIPSARLLRT